MDVLVLSVLFRAPSLCLQGISNVYMSMCVCVCAKEGGGREGNKIHLYNPSGQRRAVRKWSLDREAM